MEIIDIFAERMKILMQESEIVSTAQLSTLTGVPHSSIKKWYNKERLPKMKYVLCFADFFGCTVDYLVGFSDCKKSKPRE